MIPKHTTEQIKTQIHLHGTSTMYNFPYTNYKTFDSFTRRTKPRLMGLLSLELFPIPAPLFAAYTTRMHYFPTSLLVFLPSDLKVEACLYFGRWYSAAECNEWFMS
jgi:hypothetical protein